MGFEPSTHWHRPRPATPEPVVGNDLNTAAFAPILRKFGKVTARKFCDRQEIRNTTRNKWPPEKKSRKKSRKKIQKKSEKKNYFFFINFWRVGPRTTEFAHPPWSKLIVIAKLNPVQESKKKNVIRVIYIYIYICDSSWY